MFQSDLLILHSYYRWVVLLLMLFQIIWICYHLQRHSIFEKHHFYILLFCTLLYDIQLIIGLLLYMQSPLVKTFLENYAVGVKNRQLRFFGMEHITMMSIALLLFNVVTFLVRKKIGRTDGFKFILKWHIWIYVMIFVSIPWAFSPFTKRPYFR